MIADASGKIEYGGGFGLAIQLVYYYVRKKLINILQKKYNYI